MAKVTIKNDKGGELVEVFVRAAGRDAELACTAIESGGSETFEFEPGAMVKINAKPPADEPEQPKAGIEPHEVKPEGIESAEKFGKLGG